MNVTGSIAINGGQSRPPLHLLSRNDYDPPAHLPDQVAQIVEQVIDFRIAQIGNLDPTRHAVKPAGNLAIGFDQQRCDPPGGGRLSHLSQVVTAKLFGLRQFFGYGGAIKRKVGSRSGPGMIMNPTCQIVLSTPSFPQEQNHAVSGGSQTSLAQSSPHGRRRVRLRDRSLAGHSSLALSDITTNSIDADDRALHGAKRCEDSTQGKPDALYGGRIFFLDGLSLEHAQVHLFDMFPGCLTVEILILAADDFRHLHSEHSCHGRVRVSVSEMTVLHENKVLRTFDECAESFLTETQGQLSPLAASNIKIRARSPQWFAVPIPFNDPAACQYPLPLARLGLKAVFGLEQRCTAFQVFT